MAATAPYTRNDISRKATAILLAAIIVLQIAVSAHFVFHKEGTFQDESWTYILSNGDFVNDVPEDGVLYEDGEPFASSASVDSFLGVDFDQVILNQMNDNHPPLYYLIFSFAYSLFPGSLDYKIALIPNIIFLCICTLVLYATVIRLGATRWLGVLVALFWAISPGMVNSAVFIRMYALLSLWFMVVSYLVVTVVADRRCTIAKAGLLALFTFLGALTQYFFYIYIVVLYAACAIWLLYRRQIASFVRFIIGDIVGVVVAIAVYPTAIEKIFFSGRGQDMLERSTSGDSFFEYLLQDWHLLDTGNTGGILLLLIAWLIIAGFCWHALKRRTKASESYRTLRRGSDRPFSYSGEIFDGGSARGVTGSMPNVSGRPRVQDDKVYGKHSPTYQQSVSNHRAETAAELGNGNPRGVLFGRISLAAIVILSIAVVAYVAVIARGAPYASIRYLLAVQPVLQTIVMTLVFASIAALSQRSVTFAAVIIGILIVIITIFGYLSGIKYFDQQNDDIAELSEENNLMVGLYTDPMLTQALLFDGLEYEGSIYFSNPESFANYLPGSMDAALDELAAEAQASSNEGATTNHSDDSAHSFTIYAQSSVDINPYLEAITRAYPNSSATFVGENIDNYQVYDIVTN